MKFVLKSGATQKQIETIEKKLNSRKTSAGFDSKKYNGILNLEEDPRNIQLKLRSEWEKV
jgi:hypothetical protein